MSLIDDLRTVAANLDSSLQPTTNEVGPLVGALIAYTEHGDAVVKAAEGDDGPAAVSELLSGTKADAKAAKADDQAEEKTEAPPASKSSSSSSGSK